MIRVCDLRKQFGSVTAVDGISLQVPRGTVMALLGPNGAGKTTFVRMLTTLLKPTSGQIWLDGCDALARPQEARRAFGIVFQDSSLDGDLTVHENMTLQASLYGVRSSVARDRIRELLEFVDLIDLAQRPAKLLSGGMKRRLEIARSLLHAPRILFLDEPTVGLDPQSRHRIWEYVRMLVATRGVTVMFTTHYMDEADREAQHIAVIDRGRVVARDTPAGLKQSLRATSLDEAFIELTGRNTRDARASVVDRMRDVHRVLERR